MVGLQLETTCSRQLDGLIIRLITATPSPPVRWLQATTLEDFNR